MATYLRAKRRVELMLSNKDRYVALARRFPNPGLKWWFIAVIHELEGCQDFRTYLGNGQRWNRRTTIVPKGRGPFSSFEEGAIDAIKLDGGDRITDWSIGNVLYFLEGFNGYGYEKYHHINSPYLWSGTNHYTKGKYTSDGKYDPEAVSSQIGIALLFQVLMEKGERIDPRHTFRIKPNILHARDRLRQSNKDRYSSYQGGYSWSGRLCI
jgi:lysozyme family protein